MVKSFKKIITNIKGWRTNRKIIVIESDDWGSIRMPSKEVYNKSINNGYKVNLNPYERYDSLASEEDLTLLFDLLSKFKDKNGNHPIITANCVVANPDFDKIEESDFSQYHYELITETFKKYPKHSNNFNLWLEGKKHQLFFPQFHAREHLNVSLFMKDLRSRNKDVLFGFANKMPGSIPKLEPQKGNDYVEATCYHSEIDKQEKLSIYLEGLDLFEELFGYKSLSIIPPNYTWNDDFNQSISEKGVMFIQGMRKMREPIIDNGFKFNSRFLGMRNSVGQIALVRNVSYEPSLKIESAIVNRVIEEISIAFAMGKPAIISSHRLNYVGFIDEKNRYSTLKLLDEILKRVLKKWPEVEFFNSADLGKIIFDEINSI